jgi:hypothetical protein
MTATLIKRTGGSTRVNGFIQYQETHTFQVLAPRTSSIVRILNWPGIPAAGSKALLAGNTVWVGSPTVDHPQLDADRFIVTVPYTNQTSQFERNALGDPVDDPTQAVKRVTINWEDKEEPVNFARFRGATKNAPEMQGGTFITSAAKPDWVKDGPVTNSAGEPVMVMRKKRVKHISVSRVSRDWQQSWEDYQNAVNTDDVTIIEQDKDGTRATHSFPKYTLKMSISTPNEWKDGKLYFRPTFHMEYNEKTWIHAEVDRGTKRRVFVGQSKPEDKDGNTTYSADDLEKLGVFGLKPQWLSILTDNGKVAIGEPVLFNGAGAELTLENYLIGSVIDKPCFTNWDIELNLRPFGPLNL